MGKQCVATALSQLSRNNVKCHYKEKKKLPDNFKITDGNNPPNSLSSIIYVW